MKAADIKGMTEKEIREKLAATRLELQKLKMQHAISPLENPTQLRAKRKDIARMLTILTQKANTKQ